MSDITSQQLVVFSLGAEEYALPIGAVHEIIRFTEPRAVASDADWIRGVIGLRGKIIPIFDLAARMGLPTPPPSPARSSSSRPAPVRSASSSTRSTRSSPSRPTCSRTSRAPAATRSTPSPRSRTAWSSSSTRRACSPARRAHRRGRGRLGPTRDSVTTTTSKKGRVVVTDDSRLMRRMLADALTRQGFEVVGSAADGDEALELAVSTGPTPSRSTCTCRASTASAC